jgi:hypothetical protein
VICWFCRYGWPKPVADIYDKYIKVAGETAMHYSGAHSVWEDENFERHHVQWCLDHWGEYRSESVNDVQDAAVKQSLLELLALPDDDLYPAEAAAYNDEANDHADVEDFKPREGRVMVHR